jgi:eukaryotic-like serine/threonine-protein kinase
MARLPMESGIRLVEPFLYATPMTPENRRAALAVYAEAARLPLEERGRYLTQACTDPAIRAEVERMLENTADLSSATMEAAKPLDPGSRLGSYQVENKLGAGGMGWVYRALDLRLNRPAALKVLPRERAPTDAARRRFVREAEAASALNHPNIVTIYEIGRHEDIDFIAMELIPGKTLHDVIRSKPLGVREIVRYAIQISDALAAAHEAGIIHRDLKPGNIMVNERGLVKVLDFGLAKRTEEAANSADSVAITMLGQIVGTASYMSPEQVEGREVDARSDIFSFGCVLYEMLTGKTAFAEASSVGTMAAVLAKEPASMRERVPDVPRGFERIVVKCLQKKASDRWQNIADVKALLEELRQDIDSPDAPTATSSGVRVVTVETRKTPLVAAGALLGILLASAGWWLWSGRAPEAVPVQDLRMVTADPGLSAYPSLSRDGSLLAFASDRSGEGNLDIWLQQIGAREPIRLTDDAADESDPSISPDGTRVAFRSERDGGGVYVIPALGGEALLIAPGGRNPRFSPDGRLIAYWSGRESGYLPGSSRAYVVEAGGGQAREVSDQLVAALYPVWSSQGDELLMLGRGSDVPLNESLDWWTVPAKGGAKHKTGALTEFRAQKLRPLSGQIQIVPLEWDGQGARVLFAAGTGDAGNLWQVGISRGQLNPSELRRITSGPGRQAHASAAIIGGKPRVAFADVILNYDIWSIPVDADRGSTRGPGSRITEMASVEWASSLTSDATGMAFISRKVGDWWVRFRDLSSGRDRTLVMNDRGLTNARVSGDGSRVVYSDAGGDLLALPVRTGAVERLCEHCGTVMGLSHDGRRVLYEPLESEDLTMYDSQSGKHVTLAVRPEARTVLSGGQFSQDGKWVAFHAIGNEPVTARVWISPVRTDGPVSQNEWIAVTDGESVERDPAWAPGGGLLYYLSERDGFRCVWGRKLNAATKQIAGEPFPVAHFHSARRSLARVGNQGYLTGLSVGAGRMVLSIGELTGNIWLQESAR